MHDEIIEEALSSRIKMRALRVLMKPGAGHMSIGQLARITGVNATTLSRALQSIKKTGVADYIPVGKAQLWRIVDGYGSKVLRNIFAAWENTPQPADVLKKILKENPPPSFLLRIVLYGSIAYQEGHSDSDIDLFLCLAPPKSTQSSLEGLSPYIDHITSEIFNFFGLNPSFLIKTFDEWNKMSKTLRENIERGIILYEKNKSP